MKQHHLFTLLAINNTTVARHRWRMHSTSLKGYKSQCNTEVSNVCIYSLVQRYV